MQKKRGEYLRLSHTSALTENYFSAYVFLRFLCCLTANTVPPIKNRAEDIGSGAAVTRIYGALHPISLDPYICKWFPLPVRASESVEPSAAFTNDDTSQEYQRPAVFTAVVAPCVKLSGMLFHVIVFSFHPVSVDQTVTSELPITLPP